MKTFVIALAVVLVFRYAAKFVLRRLIRRVTSSPEYQQAASEHDRKRKAEEGTRELAPWMGNTGLDEDTERELPRYLRRELGEFLEDGGLKAEDMVYVGKFQEDPAQVHYWRIPYGDEQRVFAYVEVDKHGSVAALGWGDKEPTGAPIAL